MNESAIDVENVTKSFRIYHEKRNSIYEAITGKFDKKKHYEELPVLKNVSFSIKKGETFGIVGKNGTGKTTLLRIISGIYKPESGNVVVNGSLIPLLALGAGFQIELTAKANVIQYGILLGFKRKEIEERVKDVMKFAELEKFEDTKLKNFSSGMYARLAFATAIQIDPDIMIIDEVLQVGDLAFQQKSYEAILSFKKRGKTVILVTHNLVPIQDHCDRAMFLNKGVLESIGNPAQVIEAYKKSLFDQ
ncbi:MAG: ABC transporter ATP-binding protein [Nitrososphaera sp.]|jgi:lipopolysaccharide transport system ATP-binding protein